MAAKDTITVFDQQGQPRELPRQEFLDKVLPKLLEAAWGNADQLYQQIVFALENGLHDGVLKAAERLDELDGGAERGKVLLSATQFQTGQHDAAEATLRASLEKNGESSIAVVNLARMRQARGDVDGAQTLLSRALELDANQENALGWSCQLMQEAGGEEAVVEFLEDLSKGPGNWRATLWLAQQKLRSQDADRGIELLRGVMDLVARDPGALMGASADLGKAGKLNELIELVGPRFDERRHRPETGFNLMQAYAQLGRADEARQVHARLSALNLPPLANALAQFGQRLGIKPPAGAPAAAQPAAPGQPAGQQQLELRLFVVQGPLWMQGLGAPWLAPEKDPKAPLVTFAGFSDEGLASQPKGQQTRVDDDIARMARALPLYLSESVYLRTAARSDMVVPILPGGMFVVMGQLWPIEALHKGRPPEAKPDYIVQGLLARDDGGFRVELVIFDGKDSKEVHRIRAIGLRKLEEHALRLEDELLDWLETKGIARTVPKTGFVGKLLGGKPHSGPQTVSRPSVDGQVLHLTGISNLLAMAVPAIGLGSREILANEAELLSGCIEDARKNPDCGAAQALAACGMMFAVRYGSTAVAKSKGELLELVDKDRDAKGVLRLLSPGIYMRLGEKERSEAAKVQLKGAAGETYDKWLESIKP
ncbi:MAG: hypothetical protein NTV21_09420 [Planctomycetota bacterium]|nr:hypothetical protein [Planctomycetota bacterium]